MKITAVVPYVVVQHLDQPFGTSQWFWDVRASCLVDPGWNRALGHRREICRDAVWRRAGARTDEHHDQAHIGGGAAACAGSEDHPEARRAEA